MLPVHGGADTTRLRRPIMRCMAPIKFQFYETHLGAKLDGEIRRHGEVANPAISADWAGKVLHMRTKLHRGPDAKTRAAAPPVEHRDSACGAPVSAAQSSAACRGQRFPRRTCTLPDGRNVIEMDAVGMHGRLNTHLDGTVFARLNALALVGMSSGAQDLDNEARLEAVSDIVAESRAVVDEHTDASGFAYDIGANVATAVG